jgi:succinyl-diaminopimelate desuccinylase
MFKRKNTIFYTLLSVVVLFSSLSAAESNFEETKKELTKNLTSLVKMKTLTSNQPACLSCLLWISAQVSRYPVTIEYHTHNDRFSMTITTKETKTPKLWLVSHVDVAPAPDKLFDPVVVNDVMFGRGVIDAKNAIACYIQLLKDLNKSLKNYDFGIMLTSDTKIGGYDGVGYLLESGYLSQTAFNPDAGYDWKYEEEAKGVLLLKFQSRGISSHGSRPWLGDNAVENLIAILQKIKNHFKTEETPNAENFLPTFTITGMKGGEQTNTIPAYAEGNMDIRFLKPQTSDELLKEINTILKDTPNITMTEEVVVPPHRVDVTLPPFKLFSEIAKKKYDIITGTMRSFGASDARFFGALGIPVILISSEGGAIHSDHEWINLNNMTKYYEVLKEWVMEYSKITDTN